MTDKIAYFRELRDPLIHSGQVRWNSLRRVLRESFLANLSAKEFWKSVYICRSYDQKSRVYYFFLNTVYVAMETLGLQGAAKNTPPTKISLFSV